MSQLSSTQHGMWIAARSGAATAYHMPVIVTLAAAPDFDTLAKACGSVVERHPLLGSAIAERDGVPHLVLADRQPALESADSVDEVIARPFDLEHGPLIRFALVGTDTLVLVAHHLVFDGRSKDLLVADLSAAYAGRMPESAPASADNTAAATADPQETGAAAAFWTNRWHEPTATAVPGGALRSRGTAPGEVVEFALEIPELDGLTRFEVLVAAVHAVLGSYGNAEVVTGLDLSTRTTDEAAAIGCHVNELPLFSRPLPDTSFAGFAAGLRVELRATYPHRRVPLARAVTGIRPHAALVPVSISYRRSVEQDSSLGEVQWLVFNGSVRGALQLQIAQSSESEAVASLRYLPGELVDPEGFVADLARLLAEVAGSPDRPLGELLEFAAVETAEASVAAVAETAADAAVADPADPLVTQIRAIWEQVLDLSPIEPDDDIFDLGGHSLTITQIISRMQQQLHLEIELDDFFDNPTIAGLVAVIRS